MGKQSCRLPFDLAVFAGFCRIRPQIIPKGQMPAQFQRIRRTDIQVMRHEIRLVLIGERLPLRDAEIPFVEVSQQCQFLFDLRKKSGLFQNQIQINDRFGPKPFYRGAPTCSTAESQVCRLSQSGAFIRSNASFHAGSYGSTATVLVLILQLLLCVGIV